MYVFLITIVFGFGGTMESVDVHTDTLQQCNALLSDAHFGAPYDSVTVDFVDGLIEKKAITYHPKGTDASTYIYSCTKI